MRLRSGSCGCLERPSDQCFDGDTRTADIFPAAVTVLIRDGRLRSLQRSCALDAFTFTRRVGGLPKVGAALHVEPEIGTIPEDASEDERCWRGHAAAPITEFIDMLPLPAHRFGQGGLRQA